MGKEGAYSSGWGEGSRGFLNNWYPPYVLRFPGSLPRPVELPLSSYVCTHVQTLLMK